MIDRYYGLWAVMIMVHTNSQKGDERKDHLSYITRHLRLNRWAELAYLLTCLLAYLLTCLLACLGKG